MPQFTTKRRVRHTGAEMFALVADVERYPEFVPFCRSLKVKKRGQDERGRDTIVCEMAVAYKLIHETFTTRVTLDKPELQIIVDYLSGPFSRLDNRCVSATRTRAPATSSSTFTTNFAAGRSASSWARCSRWCFAVLPTRSSGGRTRSMGAPRRRDGGARDCPGGSPTTSSGWRTLPRPTSRTDRAGERGEHRERLVD